MCRLVAYIGHEVLLEDVLVKPINSIVMQSLHARETSWPTNGDGFGLGWYVPEISPEPALFTSISPAWNDSNLLHLASKIKSACFFSHVRAASAGSVSQENCHPFIHKRWMMMHNGEIGGFKHVKRHLRHLLDDDIYNWIRGETDSEHVFALFLQLSKGKSLAKISTVADLLQETFNKIKQLVHKYGDSAPCYFNVCITDGRRIVATRSCTDKSIVPETMHYSFGSCYIAKSGRYHMVPSDGEIRSVLITSEKLTNFEVEWHDVPENNLVMVDKDLSIQLRPL
jgi:glutamine amidotransferase